MIGFSNFRIGLARAVLLVSIGMAAIFGAAVSATAQVNITTSDTTLCGNSVSSVTLNATIGSSAGNFVTFTDDIFSGVVNLGFPFTFYGNTYTQCVLSSNGFITFDLSNANQYSNWVINSGIPGNTDVLNSIMGPYADHYPPAGGTIEYSTQGTAPNRRFVFTFCSVPLFGCTNLIARFQIVLFETTNNIEIHISNMPNCPTHNDGAAIEGIQNATGTQAVVVPGRNFPTLWTAANSSHRFTPSGTTYLLDTIPFGFFPSGINNITWYENGVTQIGTGTSVTVTPTAPSTFYVATANGCLGASSSDTVNVGIGPFLPAPGVVSPLTYCQGATAPPLAPTLFPGATAVWYEEATGGVPLPAMPVISTSVPLRDTFYVMQTLGGCSSQRSQIIINVLEQPIASLAPDRDSMCLEDIATVGFTGSAPDGSTIIWDFGAANVLNNPPNQLGPYLVQFDTPGLYNIGVVVLGPGSICVDAATTQIYVKEKPVASLDIPLPDACAGDVRLVRHTVPNVSGNFQFLWDFDGGDIVSGSDGGPYEIRWNDPGTKRVKLTVVKDGCYSEPAFDSINVYPQPTARIFAPADRSVCIGDTINLKAEVSGNEGDVYRWFPAPWFIPENYINNTNQASFRIPTSGYATLQVITRYGCVDRDSVFFDAGSCCQVFVPSAFSPNGDGKNDNFRILGTERTRRVVEIQVMNRYGQQVWRARDGRSAWNGEHDGTPQEPGVYFYRVQYECPDGKVMHISGDVTLLR